MNALGKTWLFGLAALGVLALGTPRADAIEFTNTDPLVWDLDCAVAPCTENLGQTALATFTFTDFSDADDPADTMIRMELEVAAGATNTGVLTTLAMELPTSLIVSASLFSTSGDAPNFNLFYYAPEDVTLPPYGPFDACFQTKEDNNLGNGVGCQAGTVADGLAAGQSNTWLVDFILNTTVASLAFTDGDDTDFTGDDAFRGLFADSVVNADNRQGTGICGHFQGIPGEPDSDKVCGKLRGQGPIVVDAPEPLAIGLLGLGLVALGAMRRRARSL